MRGPWGCDGPTASPEFAVTIRCFVCDGRDPGCPDCRGTGDIEIRDCPWKRVEDQHLDACDAMVRMESGILPGPGGFSDQSATFVEAYPLLRAELDHWREVQQRRAEQKAKQR